MKINIDALKSLEFKLAEYSKANGAIAEHHSSNENCSTCSGTCTGVCSGTCSTGCSGTSSAHR